MLESVLDELILSDQEFETISKTLGRFIGDEAIPSQLLPSVAVTVANPIRFKKSLRVFTETP